MVRCLENISTWTPPFCSGGRMRHRTRAMSHPWRLPLSRSPAARLWTPPMSRPSARGPPGSRRPCGSRRLPASWCPPSGWWPSLGWSLAASRRPPSSWCQPSAWSSPASRRPPSAWWPTAAAWRPASALCPPNPRVWCHSHCSQFLLTFSAYKLFSFLAFSWRLEARLLQLSHYGNFLDLSCTTWISKLLDPLKVVHALRPPVRLIFGVTSGPGLSITFYGHVLN